MKKWKTRLWRDSEGLLEDVQSNGRQSRVVRGAGYARPGSVSCAIDDTGNGFVVRFPAGDCTKNDKYVCLDYDEARELVLALTPHRFALGFEGETK